MITARNAQSLGRRDRGADGEGAVGCGLRHSGADSVTVSLKADAETVTLSVTDDGEGMPPELPPGTAGIAGMRERALLVGGRLSMESRLGQGTEVRLTIPAPRDDQ